MMIIIIVVVVMGVEVIIEIIMKICTYSEGVDCILINSDEENNLIVKIWMCLMS